MPRKAKSASSTRDEKQKERIFQAAQDEFSNKGYRGATTRGIAEKAGVNLAAIHYYWGSKDELFKAVHQHLYDNLTPIFVELAPRLLVSSPQDVIYEGVSRAAEFLASNPSAARLDVHTVVDKKNYDLPLDHKNLELLLGIVDKGLEPFRKSGALHKEMDIQMLTLSLTATYDYFFSADELVAAITGGTQQDPVVLQRFKNFVTRMLCAYVGLEPPAPKEAKKK